MTTASRRATTTGLINGAQAPPDLDALGPELHHIVITLPQAGEGSPELPLLVTGNIENLTIAVPDPDTKKKGPTMEINWGGGGGFTAVGSASSGSSDDSSADSPDNPQ
jgi:hypothetical protein